MYTQPDPPTHPLLAIVQNLMARMQRQQQMPAQPSQFDQFIHSPFVQDTLHPLAGGTPRFTQSDGLMRGYNAARDFIKPDPLGPEASEAVGLASPFFGIFMPKTNPKTDTYIHEIGHVADFRGQFPRSEGLAQSAAESAPEWHYASTDKREAFAEAFGAALQLIREYTSWDELGEAETAMPARIAQHMENNPLVEPLMLEMLQHPVFDKHPMRGWALRRQEHMPAGFARAKHDNTPKIPANYRSYHRAPLPEMPAHELEQYSEEARVDGGAIYDWTLISGSDFMLQSDAFSDEARAFARRLLQLQNGARPPANAPIPSR